MVLPEVIVYKPYRSEAEPISEVFEAKIVLHPNYFESILHYIYDSIDEVPLKDQRYKQAMLQIKKNITLTRSVYVHDYDTSKQSVPGVLVDDGESMLFRFETDAEADKFYVKLRNWLIIG